MIPLDGDSGLGKLGMHTNYNLPPNAVHMGFHHGRRERVAGSITNLALFVVSIDFKFEFVLVVGWLGMILYTDPQSKKGRVMAFINKREKWKRS